VTVSTKKTIGDRRRHLSIRHQTHGRLNRQRDDADRRYGADLIKGCPLRWRDRRSWALRTWGGRRSNFLSGNCSWMRGRPRQSRGRLILRSLRSRAP